MEQKPPRLSLAERLYLPEVVRGVAVTAGHFARNMALHTLHVFGLAKDRKASVTVQYPEERKVYPDGYRGSHRLTLKPDDSVRCTSCFLCATACPAKCIHIEAGEHPDPQVEKFPVRYEIDTLQCIYCGMCVEACPCDAIRMDTYVHPRIWGYDRLDFIETKQMLMERSKVLQERGRDALMDDMQSAYGKAEDASAEGR
ncbi:MAG TPA: NADH-quinone oxidoreductase subunit I [Candidatus Binatia bacterium]|jgi:NADH-quinone oxidoreductase subunit I|nr:NADH-quinone oxidoreductase subunit I [Candidatus Binatia bacterium]